MTVRNASDFLLVAVGSDPSDYLSDGRKVLTSTIVHDWFMQPELKRPLLTLSIDCCGPVRNHS